MPDGALDVLLSDEITTLHTGDLLVVTPGVPHAFAPTSDSDADFLVVFTRGTTRFDYYRLLDRLHRGQASPRTSPTPRSASTTTPSPALSGSAERSRAQGEPPADRLARRT